MISAEKMYASDIEVQRTLP